MVGPLVILVVLAAADGSAGSRLERSPAICIASFAADGFDQVAAQLLRQKVVTDLREAGNGTTDVAADAACPAATAAAAPGSLGLLTVSARRVGPTMRVRLSVLDALSKTSVLDQKLKLSTAELGRTLTFVPPFKRAFGGLRRLQQRALRELLAPETTPAVASAPTSLPAAGVAVPRPDPVATATGASAVLALPGIRRADELRTWGWLAAGVGSALIAAGASTGIAARIIDFYLQGLPPKECAYVDGNRWECSPDQALIITAMYTLAWATNVLLGVGGLSAIGASGLFVFARFDEQAEEPPAAPAPAAPRLARVVPHE